jgi:sarcosine oxidase delta subunit
MKDCPYCEELNEEKYPVAITDIKIQGSYYRWNCEIIYCPRCGKRLKKYNVNND